MNGVQAEVPLHLSKKLNSIIIPQFRSKLENFNKELLSINSTNLQQNNEKIIKIATNIKDIINLNIVKRINTKSPKGPSRLIPYYNLGLILKLASSSIKSAIPMRVTNSNNSVNRFRVLVSEMNKICDSLIALNQKINDFKHRKSIINSYLRLRNSDLPLWNIVKNDVKNINTSDFVNLDKIKSISIILLKKIIEILLNIINEKYISIDPTKNFKNLPSLKNIVNVNKKINNQLNNMGRKIQYRIEWEQGNNGIEVPYAVKLYNM